MSEKAVSKETKPAPLAAFKQGLAAKQTSLTNALADGIKNTNAKVRSLAIKIAVRTQDAAFIKKNITNIIPTEKSKKVLRTIAKTITRKPLIKKLAELQVKKAPEAKAEKKAEAAAPAEAPKA